MYIMIRPLVWVLLSGRMVRDKAGYLCLGACLTTGSLAGGLTASSSRTTHFVIFPAWSARLQGRRLKTARVRPPFPWHVSKTSRREEQFCLSFSCSGQDNQRCLLRSDIHLVLLCDHTEAVRIQKRPLFCNSQCGRGEVRQEQANHAEV